MTILNEIAEYTKKRYIEQEKVVPFEEIKSKARKMDSNTGFPFEKALKKERFTINELEERLRGNNIVNLGDVEYAILETSGQVTVIQKPEKRNTIPEDFNIVPEYEGIPYDLVVDGKIMDENLRIIGKNREWLKKQVEKFNIKPEEALVVTFDGKGQIFCQAKEKN